MPLKNSTIIFITENCWDHIRRRQMKCQTRGKMSEQIPMQNQSAIEADSLVVSSYNVFIIYQCVGKKSAIIWCFNESEKHQWLSYWIATKALQCENQSSDRKISCYKIFCHIQSIQMRKKWNNGIFDNDISDLIDSIVILISKNASFDQPIQRKNSIKKLNSIKNMI